MTFRDLVKHVADACRLNTSWFAETITYTTGGGDSSSIAAHVRYRRREIRDPRSGDARIVDEIKVELSREDLPDGPAGGDRILRGGETRSYVYAFAGGETSATWKATFHREIVTVQHTRK